MIDVKLDGNSADAQMSFPFLWRDQYNTIWLRTVTALSAMDPKDICLIKGEPDYRLFDTGDRSQAMTGNLDAWARRLPSAEVLTLRNTA